MPKAIKPNAYDKHLLKEFVRDLPMLGGGLFLGLFIMAIRPAVAAGGSLNVLSGIAQADWLPQMLVWASILLIGAGGHAIVYGWDHLSPAGIAKRLALMGCAFVVLIFAAPNVRKGATIFSPIPIGPPSSPAPAAKPMVVCMNPYQSVVCSQAMSNGMLPAAVPIDATPRPTATPKATAEPEVQPAAPEPTSTKRCPKGSHKEKGSSECIAGPAHVTKLGKALGESPAPWLPLCPKRPAAGSGWSCARVTDAA